MKTLFSLLLLTACAQLLTLNTGVEPILLEQVQVVEKSQQFAMLPTPGDGNLINTNRGPLGHGKKERNKKNAV